MRLPSGADLAWLAGQALLVGLAFGFLPLTDGGFGRVDLGWTGPVSWVAFACAAVLGVTGGLHLGPQLVPQPTPVAHGHLVQSGPYRWLRHPIYTAVMTAVIGVALRYASATGLVVVIATCVFFDRKSAHEERLLERAYPGYADYRQRVPAKFVPYLW